MTRQTATAAKKARKAKKRSAGGARQQATVPSPRLRADTVELLFRRRQIDSRQRQAAGIYRDAVDACRGTIPCPLDTSRVRGGGLGSPTETQMRAAATLAEAARILGSGRARSIVHNVVHAGWTIEEQAAMLFGAAADAGGKARRSDAEHVGRTLREALAELAEAWLPLPQGAGGRIRSCRTLAAEPAADSPTQVTRGRVVHATGRRVFDI